MNEQAGQLRELMRLLERKLGLINDNNRPCCGITLGQCHALVEIGRAGSLSLNALAMILNLDKSTTSRTVDNLVRQGYVLRQLDAGNRRSVVIELTESGHTLFDNIETEMNQYFTSVLQRIPDDKRLQILESVRALLDSIDQTDTCEREVK